MQSFVFLASKGEESFIVYGRRKDCLAFRFRPLILPWAKPGKVLLILPKAAYLLSALLGLEIEGQDTTVASTKDEEAAAAAEQLGSISLGICGTKG